MSWATLSPWGKRPLPKVAAKEEKALIFSSERQENGFQGAIGASLLSPCPRSIQPLPPPTYPYPGAENGPFWNHTAKKAQLCPGQRQLPHSQRPISLQWQWPGSNTSGSHSFLLSNTAPQHSQSVLGTWLSTTWAISRCGGD